MPNTTKKETRPHGSDYRPFRFSKAQIPVWTPPNIPYSLPHWHNEFEINYVVSGSILYHREENKIIGHEGDIFLNPPNSIHSIFTHSTKKDTVYYTLVFKDSLLYSSAKEQLYIDFFRHLNNHSATVSSPIRKDHPYYEEIRTSVENIFSRKDQEDFTTMLLIKSELLRIMWYLWENGDIQLTNSNKTTQHDDVATILEYISHHYTENLSLPMLSTLVYISPTTLATKFKKEVGCSIITYVNQLRIQKACRMLCENQKKIIEISEECGFNSLSNFEKQFFKIMDIPPKKYREKAIT